MRDFNFFQPFIPSKIKKSSTGEWIGLGMFILAAIVIAIPWILSNELRPLTREVQELETDVNDPKLQEDIERVIYLQAETEELRTSVDQLTHAIKTLNESEVVTQQLLVDLAQAKVDEVIFEEVTVNGQSVSIKGMAISREYIANLEYNLRQFNRYENIFVPSITYSDGYYGFSVEFNIQGGEDVEELD